MTIHKITDQYPLVGIGASAGGIDSFTRFLSAIPKNSGMAYILVQHLSPSHDSILPEILARATTIPVIEITDESDLHPNHIYVIPENKSLTVTDHSFKLTPRIEGEQHMPIDMLFSSLAKVHGKLAVGVVLSGTARDGTIGLGDIKAHNGITFAEDPLSAAWDGMPKSAISAGVVDFILRPEEIPSKLIRVFSTYGRAIDGSKNGKSKIDGDGLKRILSVVRQKSSVDFNYYKKPTIIRRINRRMAINQMASHNDYLELLRDNKAEQDALFQDLLIKVTSFFRDAEIYQELEQHIFPGLLEGRTEENPLRIWVAGCATGQEVYSLAVSLFDTIQRKAMGTRNGTRIQIFASDISEVAIKKARSGVYSASELKPVSEEQLNRYFTRTDGGYKAVKSLRDTIVFTIHNFLLDPPFRNIDLISCRNVFIYLEQFLQKKALSTFHYALKENGFLLMGRSESIGHPTDLFAPHAKNSKLYSRKPGLGRFVPSTTVRKQEIIDLSQIKKEHTRAPDTDFKKSAEKVLISGYTPASIIIDEFYEIVHINGNIEPYVIQSSGRPTHDLMKTARKELAFELRNALHKAKDSQAEVRKNGIPVKTEWEEYSVDIEIVPLSDLVDSYYLVLFWKKSADRGFLEKVWHKVEPTLSSSRNSQLQVRNSVLEKELEQIREDMRGISEDQEAYNEELQSANEELLSGNEEMQSLNEELETSKEELESTNEELIVVNRELIDKQEELNDTLVYADDLIATVHEPFVVLDGDLRVQKVNTSYYQKFDGTREDIEGKHFFEIHNGFWYHEGLQEMLLKILPKSQEITDNELKLKDSDGSEQFFRFNAREIVRDKASAKLILLEISDITQKKTIERAYLSTIEELKKTNEQLDQFVHIASHDLQEPLRKITTFATRVMDKGMNMSDGELGIYLEKITASSARMSALIKNMLNYARLGHQGQPFEPTSIEGIVNNVLADFELVIEQENAEMKIGRLPTLEAIPMQMNQLFYNLISNALKFSKKGISPIVSISSRKLSKNEIDIYDQLDPILRYHEIVVKDNGIGFNKKYTERIFTIFQRLHTSSQYLGTGIGLALCKKVILNHNGHIYTESIEGEGAAFHIILPENQPEVYKG